MEYLPKSEKERKEIFDFLGIKKFEDLLKFLPQDKILKEPLKIPKGKSEIEVREIVEGLAKLNKWELINFAGGGAYDHYIPAVVNYVISRPEFYTAYTPYQAEVSQGTLQAMFEYQTLICELTGMDISNSSMYEGGSALAEAILMACRIKNKYKILIPENLNPLYKMVVYTYTSHVVEIKEIPYDRKTGKINYENTLREIDEKTAGIVLQHPNFFGILEDPEKIEDIKKRKNLIFIMVFDPTSLGILKPPGEYDVDIAVAEGQSLGLPLGFGGPYLGIFTCKEEFIRMMPGRIAGETVDMDGKRAFAMILQTREQHIRREKATSNICTNEMLCALAALVYLSVIGKEGIKELGKNIVYNSHTFYEMLLKEGIKSPFDSPFFKEFVIELPIPAKDFVIKMSHKGFLPGTPLEKFGFKENWLLVAVTEKRKKEEMENYIKALKEVLKE
jgi:glycine dehydrogenase subunit 1